VLSLIAPTEDEVRRFISKQKDSSLSYPHVGASATAPRRVGKTFLVRTPFHGICHTATACACTGIWLCRLNRPHPKTSPDSTRSPARL
jgi:hypothetical protein